VTEPYQPPAIAERVPVGDPLIVGYTLSPKWRPPAEPKSNNTRQTQKKD
jgi:hypothetical protein